MKAPEKKEIVKYFSDNARDAALVGDHVEIPKVLDAAGEIRDVWVSPSSRYKLTLTQAKFLKAYEESNLDLDASCQKSGVTREWALRFLKTRKIIDYFREQNELKAIADVATPTWKKATLAKGVVGEWVPPTDSAMECLKMLKDINHPKAAAQINFNNAGFFQMPTGLSSEQMALLKTQADKEAMEGGDHVAA